MLNKILSPEQWEASIGKDKLELSDMDVEFIHFSTDDQLFKTLGKFYPNQERVVVRVDSATLVGDLRFETNPGRETKYYHLYDGHIPMSSVISVYKTEPIKTK